MASRPPKCVSSIGRVAPYQRVHTRGHYGQPAPPKCVSSIGRVAPYQRVHTWSHYGQPAATEVCEQLRQGSTIPKAANIGPLWPAGGATEVCEQHRQGSTIPKVAHMGATGAARRATTETAANETPNITVSHTGLLRGARTGTRSATAEWRARSQPVARLGGATRRGPRVPRPNGVHGRSQWRAWEELPDGDPECHGRMACTVAASGALGGSYQSMTLPESAHEHDAASERAWGELPEHDAAGERA
jgi:hypothetical protein